MKVDPIIAGIQRKPDANGAVISLNAMEAGFLRAALYQYSSRGLVDGFADNLFRALDKFNYPEYDKKYPNWRDEKKDDFYDEDDEEEDD